MSMFISDILQSFLGPPRKHNDAKGQIAFDCPACALEKGKPQGDGKGNLEVNYNKGVFRCWSCMYTNNMHGYIPKLIKRFGNSELLKEYLILKPDEFDYTDKETVAIEVKFPIGYKKIIDCNEKSHKYYEVMSYLSKRNIGMDLIEKFDIGYTMEGDFHSRIIIPSYDEFNEINYFIARTFDWKIKPKYLNPEAEKESIIFNENKVNWDSTIYLVEGVFDHIVIPNSIPLLGKYISDKLFEALYTKASTNIVILLDSDAYYDALQLYKKLDVGDLKDRIKMCIPEEGFDPSLIYQKQGKNGIIKLLRTSHKVKESRIY
jgi:DNA primase